MEQDGSVDIYQGADVPAGTESVSLRCPCFLGGWKQQAELQYRGVFQRVAAHPHPGWPGPAPISRWGTAPRRTDMKGWL